MRTLSAIPAPAARSGRASPRDRWIVVGLVVLFVAFELALVMLWRYKTTPGVATRAPATWPEGSTLARPDGQPVLVLFAHPRCSCTRATLVELRTLMSGFDGRVRAYVLFAAPEGVAPDWADTDLWASAASIPGVSVRRDDGEREAHRFAAVTSGHVEIFDGDGGLRYAGGITSARGHVGGAPGADEVLGLLASANLAEVRPVFGCPLATPGETTP